MLLNDRVDTRAKRESESVENRREARAPKSIWILFKFAEEVWDLRSVEDLRLPYSILFACCLLELYLQTFVSVCAVAFGRSFSFKLSLNMVGTICMHLNIFFNLFPWL